ncbi:unnamed protein product [Lymnaea stagnalis]|uniref:Uncharacterized protein n=1 Tax=Lymnaea stagnalis TaxID=6523 RepID=A0AAV2I9Q7_LYMST
MAHFTNVHHALLLTFVTLTSTVVCQDRSRTNIFNSDPIHVEDYGAPPATSTILLYDCTGTHRAKPDSPGSFQVFHNNEWWTQLCQEALFWNQTLCRCEYPAGKRPERECRDYRATSTEPTGTYEQYVNNNWITRDCSLAVAGLVWDQDSCQCVWGPRSKEMVTGQGVTPCDIMLNLTFEDGIKDTAKGSFVEVGRGPLVPIFTLDPQDAIDGTKAAFFSETALNIWYFAVSFKGNELGTSLRVEFRFKMTNDPSNRDKYQIFISNGCNISNPGYTTPSLAIGYRPADQSYLLAFETASARKAIVCTKRLGAYTWHTVSLIYEDGTLLLRVDDQPCIISQDFTGPIQKTPCPLTIGADPLERQSMYKGYLDNLLIARYCRRFIDSDPAEAERKGPMPVESAGPLTDDVSDPNPPFGKSPNDVRRSITNSKYIQVVGDSSLGNSPKSRPLSGHGDVSLTKEVHSSSKVPGHANNNKGTATTSGYGHLRSSKPISRELPRNKVHITSSTGKIQNNDRISKDAPDHGKAFIASNTDYFVRGKKPANSEKNTGYASRETFDTGANSQSYIHKVTDGGANSQSYIDKVTDDSASSQSYIDKGTDDSANSQSYIDKGTDGSANSQSYIHKVTDDSANSQSYIDKGTDGSANSENDDLTELESGSGKPKTAINNYKPSKSQGTQYGEDATVSGKFNQDKSYGQSIQSGKLNNKEGTGEINGDRSYDETADSYDSTVEVQDKVSGSSKDSYVENQGTVDYEEIEDSENTNFAKEISWKDSGAEISASDSYDTFEDSRKDDAFKQSNGRDKVGNNKGNLYDENIRSEKENQFGKSKGQNRDEAKTKFGDTQTLEWNKSQQKGNQLKSGAVGGTYQSNGGNDVTSGHNKYPSGSFEGGYRKQPDARYDGSQKQQPGAGQSKSNDNDEGVEYSEEESIVGDSKFIKNQQPLNKNLNQFDSGRGHEKTKQVEGADYPDRAHISKQKSNDKDQDGSNQDVFHKTLNQDPTEGSSGKADAYHSKVIKNKENSRNSNEDNVLRNVGRHDEGRSKERNGNSESKKNSNPYTPMPPNVYAEKEKTGNSNSRPDSHYKQSTSANGNSANRVGQQSQSKGSSNPDSFRHKVSNSVANLNKANTGKFENTQNQVTNEDSPGSQRHTQVESGRSRSYDELKKAETNPVLETQFQIVRPKHNTQKLTQLHQSSESKSDKKEKSTGSNNSFQNSQTRSNVGSSTQLNNFKQGSQNSPNRFSSESHQQAAGYLHKSQQKSNGYAIEAEKQTNNQLHSNLNQKTSSQNNLPGSVIIHSDKKTTEKDNANQQSQGPYSEPRSVGLVKGMPKGGKNKKKAWYDKADPSSTNDQANKGDQTSRVDKNGDEAKTSELKKEHSDRDKNNDSGNKEGGNNSGGNYYRSKNDKGNLKDSEKSYDETQSVHKLLKQRNLNEKTEIDDAEDENRPNPKSSFPERPKLSPNVARESFAEYRSREELPHMRYNVNDMRYPKPFRRTQNSDDSLGDSNHGSPLKKDDGGAVPSLKLKGDNLGDNSDALDYEDTEETAEDAGDHTDSSRKLSRPEQARKQNVQGEFGKTAMVQAEPYHIAEIIKDSTTERTVGGGNIYFYVKKGEEQSSITHTAVEAENAKKSDDTEVAKDEALTISNSDLNPKEATKDQTGNEKPQSPQSPEKVTDNSNDGVKVQELEDPLHVNGGDTTHPYNEDQFENPDNIPTTVRQMPLDVSKLGQEDKKGSVESETPTDVSTGPDIDKD